MKYELSITADYVPTWGMWEGVREIVSNAIDQGDPEVMYKDETLIISNPNTSLPKEAMLLGHTTKGESDIGQFGEGLKVGLLALTRAGHEVIIKTGNEIWKTTLSPSKVFNANVLTITTRARHLQSINTSLLITIDGVTEEMWEEIRFGFLNLNPPTNYEDGVIKDPAYQGRVYYKDVFICKEDLMYGYNLTSGQLNRDRSIVRGFDLQWEISRIWANALTKDNADEVMTLITKDSFDVAYIDNFLSSTKRGWLGKVFQKKHGDDVIPVSSVDQSCALRNAGTNTEIVSNKLCAILSPIFGSFDEAMDKAADKNKKVLTWEELTGHQRQTWRFVKRLFDVPEFQFCIFSDPDKKILGSYLATSMLEDPFECLKTILSKREDKEDVYCEIIRKLTNK